MYYDIDLRAGRLGITTRREDLPLEQLLDFASRQNPRRGFLFVSKVLGKHIPCCPARMRAVYDQLADQLVNLPGPVVVIGMAETATGLGGGVADSLSKQRGRDDVLYMHTTRHHLDAPTLLSFDEDHSHAPDHILYAPRGERACLFGKAQSLVLVDDEISTGRTLGLLAKRISLHLPRLRQVVLTSIVNWLPVAQQTRLAATVGRELGFVELLAGEFTFVANPDFRPVLPHRVNARQPSRYAREDTGRTGLLLPAEDNRLPVGELPAGPLALIGTGEFTYAPFLAAEALEQQGHDILFQSTTRSPILEGEAIGHKLTFCDEHGEDIVNYLYNLPTDRQVIVAYEHPAMAAQHDFLQHVDATIWTLPVAT